jgi:hypothetical protein
MARIRENADYVNVPDAATMLTLSAHHVAYLCREGVFATAHKPGSGRMADGGF